MWSLWIVCLPWLCMAALLDGHGKGAVDHKIGPRDAAGDRTRDEDHAVCDLLGRAELAGRIDLERRGEQVGHVLLDVLPDAALEIGVARRDAVHADALAD